MLPQNWANVNQGERLYVIAAIRFHYSSSRIAESSEQRRKGIQLSIRKGILKVTGKEMAPTLLFKGIVLGLV